MTAEVIRLPEPDDAHPLDWYPGDEPESRSMEEVEALIAEEPGALRAIAARLDRAPWHPSLELAGSLAKAAATALERATIPSEVVDVRKGLLMAEELFRLRGAKLIEANLLVAQRIRAEHQLGRMLRAGKDSGTFGQGKRSTDSTNGIMNLRDIGVSKYQSSQFQKVAALDPDDLDHWVEGVVNDPDVELSTSMVLDVLWKEQAREKRTADRVRVVEATLPADVTLAVADARTLPLGDETIDLTVTSPPYGLDIGYTDGDVAVDEWVVFIHACLAEALRVTKPHGRLALNVPLDTRKPYPRPTYMQAVWAAVQAGWTYQFTITWDEGNTSKGNRSLGSVNSSSRPVHVSPAEMIAVFSNGEWAPSFEGGKDDILPDDWQSCGREVWRIPGESNAWEGHPAPFPEALARRLIQYLSPIGAAVLDPFSGSGTTVAVASRYGRRAYGYDVSEEYVESAKRRVAR